MSALGNQRASIPVSGIQESTGIQPSISMFEGDRRSLLVQEKTCRP